MITVKLYNGISAKCTVTVKEAPKSIALSESEVTIGVGETVLLTSKPDDGAAATGRSYTSSNSNVAEINPTSWNCSFTGVHTGTAKIKVTTYNGKSSICNVTVKSPPKAVKISKYSVTLGVGETMKLSCGFYDDDYARSVKFTSDNSSVVSILKNGHECEFKALKEGTARLTVKTYNGQTAECEVIVKPSPKAIYLSRGLITMKVGETAQLNSYLDDGYAASNRTYRTSNEKVVQMLSTYWVGKIKAVAPGTARNYDLFKVLRSDVSVILHLPHQKRYVSYAELAPLKDVLKLYATRNDDLPATTEIRRLYSNVLRYESVADRSAFSIIAKHSLTHSNVYPRQLKAEVLYHWLNLALFAFVAALLACILSSLNVVFRSLKLDVVANVMCIVTSVILTAMFAMRAYVAARPPMSSLYEIVMLVALMLMVFESGAFVFCKRRSYTLMIPVTFMAAALLFFAKFVLEPGDTFQLIPNVLNSSVFLTVHVFAIALGFASMILSGVVAHLVLYRKAKQTPIFSLMYGTLVFGLVFTVLGTLLGGVWADFAWGRFWGFDPKECGALFVILWALLSLHLWAGKIVSPRVFALLNALNVIVTFLCWFGVNLLGVGLHSYGFQSDSLTWLTLFVGIDLMVIAYLGCRKF